MINTSVNYGVEISTSYTSVTDESIGLVSGYLRYVTGRDNLAFNSKFGPDEIYTGQNKYEYFTGFIVKNGLSNPSRTIDISKNGDYGTLSSFDISIRNNDKIWSSLNIHNIRLINKEVKLFVIIDGVFYQIWNGVVEETPRTATELKIKCRDNSASIHKDLPHNNINGSDVPVAVGMLDYIKATKITDSSTIALTNSSNSAYLYEAWFSSLNNNFTEETLDYINEMQIDIQTIGKVFVANELAEKYLRIARFNIHPGEIREDRTARDNDLVYIVSNYQTDSDYITRCITQRPPSTNPPFIQFVNDMDSVLSSGYTISNYGKEYWNNYLIPNYIMRLDCVDAQADYVLAQSGILIDTENIYSYDKETATYIKLPLSCTDNNDGTISLNIPQTIDDDSIKFYQPVGFEPSSIFASAYNDGDSPNTVAANQPPSSQRRYVYSGFYNDDKSFTMFLSGVALTDSPGNGYPLYGHLTLYETYSEDVLHEEDSENFIYAGFSGLYFSNAPIHIDGVFDSGIFIINDATKNKYAGEGIFSFNGGTYGTPTVMMSGWKDVVLDKNNDTYLNRYFNTKYGLELITYVDLSTITLDNGGEYVTVSGVPSWITNEDLYILPNIEYDAIYLGDRDWIKFRVMYYGIDYQGRTIEMTEEDDVGYQVIWNIDFPTDGNHQQFYINGLPKEHFITTPTYTQLPLCENWWEEGCTVLDGNGNPTGDPVDNFGDEIFKIPDYLKEGLVNKTIKYIKVIYRLVLDDSNYTGNTFNIREIGCFVKRKQSLLDNFYVKPLGEAYTNTSDVYNTFKYILETNDEIPASSIEYNNLPTARCEASGWITGKIFQDKKNSKEYLKQLCIDSDVALFPDRRGRRKFNCWLETSGTIIDDHNSIIKDSLKEFKFTPISDVFNSFYYTYDYDYGSEKYTRGVSIKNTDYTSFPTIHQDWTEYVSGIVDYVIASGLWETARQGYLLTGTVNTPTTNNELSFFPDRSIDNDHSSAIRHTINQVNWTSRQHYLTDYSIPLTSGNINVELTDVRYLDSNVFVDSGVYKLWVNKITYNVKDDKIDLDVIAEPNDAFHSYTIAPYTPPDDTEPEPIVLSDIHIIDADDSFCDRSIMNIIDANERTGRIDAQFDRILYYDDIVDHL